MLCVSCMGVVVKLCGIVQLVLCLFLLRGEMMNTLQGIIFSPRRLRLELVVFSVCPLCVLFLCSFMYFCVPLWFFGVFSLCSFRPYFHHYALSPLRMFFLQSLHHYALLFFACITTMHISCALTLRNPPSEQGENSYQPSL